jgi:hypothetical protein
MRAGLDVIALEHRTGSVHDLPDEVPDSAAWQAIAGDED